MKIIDIQRSLIAAGFPVGRSGADGVMGDDTRAAVKAFQKAYGLVVDGKPGPQTITALKQVIAAPKPAKPEPDKAAMADTVPATPKTGGSIAPPANANSLQLLDTTRPIDTIFIHCTATPEGKDYTVADIRSWHKARGFTDIGYHYVIYRDGRVMLGRPVGQVGAHVEGHNTGSIGISYVGGVTADGKKPKDTRTVEQRSSLLWLVRELKRKFPKIKRVRGHNEVAAKACPSFTVANDPLGKFAA